MKTFNISITQVIAMLMLIAPDISILPQYGELVGHIVAGRWNSATKKIEYIAKIYGANIGKAVIGILIGIGGAAVKRHFGFKKIGGLGPVNVNI